MGVTLNKNNGIANVVFDLPDSKVNLLTAEVLKKLDGLLDEIKNDANLKAVVFTSHKPNVFIAGADIKEIEAITDPQEGAGKALAGQDIFNKLEDLPIATLAVIDGVCLGGGCELVLSCQYRMATFNEKVLIGLPEVNLGILPGFGGTYRMPRTVGLSEGLKMVLSAKPIDGRKALKIGLVDRLVPQAGLQQSTQEFLNEVIAAKAPKYRPKKQKGLIGFLESNRLGQEVIFARSRSEIVKATKGFYPAPLKALEVIKGNFYMDRASGLARERSGFGELVGTAVCKNLIKVFYLSEKYKKLTLAGSEKIQPQRIEKAAILGAGIMGGGIAQLLSYKDIWSRLKDINLEALGSGLKAARKVYEEAVSKRRLTEAEAQRHMAMITTTLDYSGFKDVDIVIEAVVENLEIKRKVFKELSEHLSPKTILATNTSALSVSKMAEVTKDPSKFVGFHFFNPVHRMPLVEIITTHEVSAETIVSALNLAKRLGKIPILVKDCPGFLVNRILLNYIGEAGYLLEETGDVEGIDRIMTQFGMPMGPFTLSDEVGLDVGIKVLHILEEAFGERFKPAGIFDKTIALKIFGKKTGKGFYVHEKGKRRILNPEITALLPSGPRAPLNEAECQERLIFVMINEAARCLEDGVVKDPYTVDAGMIFGTGFPPFTGGLLRYADSLGAPSIVRKLDEYGQKHQTKRLQPSALLRRLAQENRKFYDS